MTDKELLEAAAKAAGIDALYWNDGDEPYSRGPGVIYGDNWIWNPLNDDGEALRLAVKLRFTVNSWGGGVAVMHSRGPDVETIHGRFEKPDGETSVTRRAIVCAAASIGTSKGVA